jgi:uncharacterized protein (UPF0335 family)
MTGPRVRALTVRLPCRAARLDPAVPIADFRDVLERGFTMSGPGGIAGDRLRAFVERIERLEEDIKGLNEDKKDVYAEAKGEGFDVKILKEVIRLRKQDQEERDERESLLDVYMHALGSASAPLADAAE